MPSQSRIIVQNNNKYLLLKIPEKHTLYGGRWQLPGGKLDQKETAKKGAIRELLEETGIEKEELEKLKMITNSTSFETHIFVTDVDTEKINLSGEHTDYQWLTYEELRGKKEEEISHYDSFQELLVFAKRKASDGI